MEEEQQLVGNDASHIAKGKRTKRLRLLSPCGATVMTSSCSSGDNSSTTYESTDQEEEDMANCLILLAQGGATSHHQPQEYDHQGNNNKISNRKFAEIATPSATNSTGINTKVGFCIYECKTCNRTFPSFQALGGHRASHKKPKLMMAEEKKPPPPPSQQKMIANNYYEIEEAEQPHIKIGPPISLQLGNQSHRAFHGNNNKAKIHECSICGSEFTSGQALGGHMRRHRVSTNTTIETSSNTTTVATGEVQPRNILELDLNLPAPEDDLRESKFQFPAAQKSMVLSAAPALVDCHY